MALSNWLTLSVHSEDGLTNGIFHSDNEFHIEIYKSNIHLYDEQAFREDSGFRNNLVMKINDNSEIKYLDINIDVIKPVTNEVYITARKGYRHEDTHVCFAGCGVYGYSGEEWVGVTKSQVEKLREHIQNSNLVRENDFEFENINGDNFNQGDKAIIERATGQDASIYELYSNDEPILSEILDNM